MIFFCTLFRNLGVGLFFIVLTSCTNIPSQQSSLTAVDTSKIQPKFLTTFTPIPNSYVTSVATQTTIPDKTRTPVPNLVTPIEQTASTPLWKRVTDWTPANQVQVLIIDQAGSLWAGGPGGLVNWDLKTNQPTIYILSDTSDSEVVALTQTPDSALWIATFGHGLFRFEDNNWQSFTTENGLPTNYIAEVGIFSDGVLWVNTSKYARDQFPLPKPALGTFDGQLWTTLSGGGFFRIITAQDNSLWALGWYPDFRDHWGNVFHLKKDEGWEEVNIVNGNEVLTAIGIAPNDDIWVATETGLFRYQGHNWQKISPPWLGKTISNVSSMAISEGGSAWFGFSYMPPDFPPCGTRLEGIEEFGVYRYENNRWTHFTTEEGLVDNKICDIVIDNKGDVWFGSYDKGISRFDGKTWKSFIISKSNNP